MTIPQPDLGLTQQFINDIGLKDGRMFFVRGKSKVNLVDAKQVLQIAKSEPADVYIMPARVPSPKLINPNDPARGYSRQASDLEGIEWLAVVAEHDDLSPDESIQKVAESGLPEPSLQIFSGGKSIHHWWILKNPIDTQTFVDIQKRLASLLQSDPNVDKPTQVFRLPGFRHTKTGGLAEFKNRREDLFGQVERLPVEELLAVLPELQDPPATEQEEIDHQVNTKKASSASAWFPLLSTEGQRHAMVDMLGHIWTHTMEHEQSHNLRFMAMSGIVGHTLDINETANIWKEAAAKFNFDWDKTTKSDAFSWAKEILSGQKKQDGRGKHPKNHSIGTTIYVANQLGWTGKAYKSVLANDADHLQKLVFAELFNGGDGWITFQGVTYKHVLTHYEPTTDVALDKMISSYLMDTEEYASKANSTNVAGCKTWMRQCTGIESRPNPDGYVNCRNGILEVRKGGHRRLISHESEEAKGLIFMDEPQFDYDPDADRSAAEELLECLPDPDGRALFMRTMAFAINWVQAAQKHGHAIALFATGEGSNGKDTNISILKRIFGESAVASVDLLEFYKADHGASFRLVDLETARLNLPSETPSHLKIDHLKSFKNATSANRIPVERKGVQGYYIEPRVAQMFPTNDGVILNNVLEADERRYMGVRWPYSYTTNEDKLQTDPNKFKRANRRFLGFGDDEKWVQDNLLPGYFNILLDYFEDVCAKGFDDLLPYSRKILQEMGNKTNHFKRFLDEVGATHISDVFHEGSIKPQEFFEKIYKPWCLENGRAYKPENSIFDDDTNSIQLIQITHGSDRTCMSVADMIYRLQDSGLQCGKPNQKVATKYGLSRANYIKNLKLQ